MALKLRAARRRPDGFDAVKELAMDHNFLVGPSSGAVYAAAKMVAERLTRGRLVLVLGDDRRKFTSIYSQFKVFEVGEFRRLIAEASSLPASLMFIDANRSA